MKVYYVVLTIISFLLLLTIDVRSSKKTNKKIYVVIGFILVLVSGFRYNVGADYTRYVSNYFRMINADISLFSQPFLTIIAKLCNLTGLGYKEWFFIMSLITISPVFYVLAKRNDRAGLSILLFLFMGCWHYSFNLVKQCAAASIIFLGFSALCERKLSRWIFICLMASMFHVSAIFMIPVYFAVENKISIKKIVIITFAAIVMYFAYDTLFIIIDVLKQNEGVVELGSLTRNNGVSLIRVIVNWVPMIMTFVFNKSIFVAEPSAKGVDGEIRKSKDDEDVCYLFYLSFLNAILNIVAMRSIYLYRICVYTNLFNILYFPKIIYKLHPNTRKVVIPLMLIFYFAFWSYDIYKDPSIYGFTWIFGN